MSRQRGKEREGEYNLLISHSKRKRINKKQGVNRHLSLLLQLQPVSE